MLESRVMLSRVQGIDVSHWQGTINWPAVRAAGKEFAFAKATEGTNFIDPRANSNLTNGPAAGMVMGVYHYANPSTATGDAAAEANYFVDNAGQWMTEGFLPPVLDLEEGGPSMTLAQLSNWVHAFQNQMMARIGMHAIIYCNTNYATNELNNTVNIYPLWIANWNTTSYGNPLTDGSPPCGVFGPNSWEFWQYSSTGAVSGISGNVDLDVFNGDRAALDAMRIGDPDIVPPDVTDSQFAYLTSPHRLSFTFSEDVGASIGVSDLLVRDIDTQAQIIVTNVSWNAATRTATFTLNNAVPDGRFRATLDGDGIEDAAGNPMGADHTFDFHFLRGDANGDGTVNLADFNILAQNFGQSPRDFSQGDFDYNGVVNLSDFNLIAGNFGVVINTASSTSSLGDSTKDDARDDELLA
jgi:GH25 family lysozyme M1 (1,4-beta-N-acetylmuramidase)